MHPDLSRFVESCPRSPGLLMPVIRLWKAFNTSLPPGMRGAWARDRFVIEIGRAFQIGDIENSLHVAGLGLPGATWRSENGRLIFREAT